MASSVDSEAVFFSRIRAVGLGDADEAALRLQGITTVAGLAFACSYVPGGDDASFLQLADVVLGGGAAAGRVSAWRRLYFECYTVCAAELKLRLEQTGETPPRKIPPAERSARREAQRLRLPGVSLDGVLDFSDSLLDLLLQMLRTMSFSMLSGPDALLACKSCSIPRPNRLSVRTRLVTCDLHRIRP